MYVCPGNIITLTEALNASNFDCRIAAALSVSSCVAILFVYTRVCASVEACRTDFEPSGTVLSTYLRWRMLE